MLKDRKLGEYTHRGRFSFDPSGSENAPGVMLSLCVRQRDVGGVCLKADPQSGISTADVSEITVSEPRSSAKITSFSFCKRLMFVVIVSRVGPQVVCVCPCVGARE